MNDRDVSESDIRATCAEAVDTLRIISEGIGPLTQRAVIEALNEAERRFAAARELAKEASSLTRSAAWCWWGRALREPDVTWGRRHWGALWRLREVQ